MSGYIVKLVRDRIARVGPARGFTYDRCLDSAQHRKLLRAKLLEEVGEYLLDPSMEELADVYEAVYALAVVDQGADIVAVGHAARRKREERGSFIEGTIMVAVDVDRG